MTIQIDGINTQNKGAELMLVAILEELERKVPKAKIYINPDASFKSEILTSYESRPILRSGRKLGKYVGYAFHKFGLRQPIGYFKENYSPKHVDIILDASGFKYSDQWNRSDDWLNDKQEYYRNAKENGTKICFLTQAFGPFETLNGKRSVDILNTYCDLIYAREELSYNFLIGAGASQSKVKQSCDFTLKVSGTVPECLKHLEGQVAIIPNKKMVTHGGDTSSAYVNLLLKIVGHIRDRGDSVFLLNHEAYGDLSLCNEINSCLSNTCEVVSGLGAKEVKGVIGISKLVVSSRFHGVASALSQGVPCLATSWNHKYEMLFNDFNQNNTLIKSDDFWNNNKSKIDAVLDNIERVKQVLINSKPVLLAQIEKMWSEVLSEVE